MKQLGGTGIIGQDMVCGFGNDKKYLKKLPAYGITLPNGIKDTVEKIDGKKTVVQRVERVVFDENIRIYGSLYFSNNNVFVRSRNFSMKIGINNIVSNVKVINWNNTKENIEDVTEISIMALSSSTGWNEADIIIPLSYFEEDTSIDKARTILNENPVVMYYELKNPIYTQI